MTAAMPLRVGTRGSPLALIQTHGFIDLLRRARPDAPPPEVCVIRTTGDSVQHRRLADIGGKGLFAKEIHEALADRRIDLAVHSVKDLETRLTPGVVLACTLPREDPRDALVLAAAGAVADPLRPFDSLPPGSTVGTASVRRQAQLLHARPDLVITTLRGNVQTRLGKLAEGVCDATLLAFAGLRRLGLAGSAAVVLAPTLMVPAAGQGIIGVTAREADSDLCELLAAIEDLESRAAAIAERALLERLDGSCRTPIGAHARLLANRELELTGLVARPDGSFLLRRTLRGLMADATRLGSELGARLYADAPNDLFA
jgi:hydroxymethylbilane synthase